MSVSVLTLSTLSQLSCAPRSPEEGAAPAKTATVEIAVNPVPQATLVILAMQNNYFRDEGIDAHLSKFTSGKLAFDAALAGAANMATVADIPIMYAAMSGQTPAVVATIERSGRSVKILARSDQAVHAPEDLRGKKIGTFKASSAEFFLDRFLAKHNISINQVTVVHLQPPDLVPAITRGDLSAISIWEPYIFVAQKTLASRAIVFEDSATYTETFNIACTDSYLKSHQPEVRAVIRALRKAEAFLKASPDAAQSTVAAFTSMDPQTLKAIWPPFDFTLDLEASLPALLRSEAEFAVATGTIAAPKEYPDFGAYLHPEFLKNQ
jgi:ABC-type nitrate/sulfonate/bicarbonate transport system substrate-binding protein